MASFKNLVSTTSAQISSGGTITGDLVINGDLQVDGGGSLSFDEIVQGTQVIDVDNTEALLVRKDGDGGDVFIVDTTNSRVGIGGTPTQPLNIFHSSHAIALLESSGTDSASSVQFKNDARTYQIGVRGSASDSFIIRDSTATTDRLTIKSDGEVLITPSGANLDVSGAPNGSLSIGSPSSTLQASVMGRTTSNATALHLFASATDANTLGDMRFNVRENNDSTFATLTNPAFKFIHYTTDLVTILRDGSVGIGITPTVPLTVNNQSDHSDVAIFHAGGGTPDRGLKISTYSATNANAGVDLDAQNSTGQFKFSTAGTERMRLTSTGLGIGTSSPESALHINTSSSGGIGGKLIIDNQASDADGNGTEISFFNASGASASGVANSRIRSVASGNTNGYSQLQFWTYHASEGHRMTLSSDGNLGLGNAGTFDNPNSANKVLEIATASPVALILNDTRDANPFCIENRGAVLHFAHGTTSHMVLDSNSRISLSNNDSGGTGGRDSTSGNTILGYSAGNVNSGAVNNTFIGHASGSGSIDGGDNNTAIGAETLQALTTASRNQAIGSYSGFGITTGDDNVLIGNDTGFAMTGTSDTVLIGHQAGTAINHTDADGTVSIGSGALKSATSAIGNTAIGLNALKENTTGDNNIAIGHNAMNSQQAGGTQSVSATSHNNTYIGVDAGGGNYADVQSNYNVGIGNGSIAGVLSGSNNNTAIGYASLNANTQGDNNVAVGYFSMGVGTTTGSNNVAIGRQSLEDATSATDNTAVGHQAGANITTGNTNVAVGRNALVLATACTDVVSIGAYSMDAVTTSTAVNGSVAIGKSALGAFTGGGNCTAIGYQSLEDNVSGYNNTAVGYQSLANATGAGNSSVGSQAGDLITSGTNNTLLGSASEVSANSATNQTVIGQGATGQADNSVTLGNTATTQVYVAPHASEGGATQQLVFRDNADKGIINYDHNNGMFKITVEGVEHSRFTSLGDIVINNGGINFPDDASSSASSDANTLDDYEEGTFTPTLTTNATDFTSVTYDSATSGRYTKVGNLVHVQGFIKTDAINIGSASGDVSIGGLPFTAITSSTPTQKNHATINISLANGWAGENPSHGLLIGGGTIIQLYYADYNVDANSIAVSDVTGGTVADKNQLYFAGTYLV